MLQNAILDERSTAIAIASPLFALSVVPYLLFLKNLWRVETATSEQKYAFATLLVFVLISIPAEVHTKERYDTVLSNISDIFDSVCDFIDEFTDTVSFGTISI